MSESETAKQLEPEVLIEKNAVVDDSQLVAQEDWPRKPRQVCGKTKSRAAEAKQISPELRLTYHREVPVDRLKSAIPKPKGYLPPAFLPAWLEMPIEAKLPSIMHAAQAIFFARGKLGQKIYQEPKYYTVYDPLHRERVIPEPYNALHDPHAKGYLNKPGVRKLLLKQGLITPVGHVLCSPKDFNTFRKYLSTMYHDEIQNKFDDMHEKEQMLRKSNREVKQYFEKTGGVNFIKMQNAKSRQDKIYHEKVLKIEIRHQFDDERAAKWKQVEHERLATRQMISFEMQQARKLRLAEYKANLQEKQTQLVIMGIQKEQRVAERIAQEKEAMLDAQRNFVITWMNAKMEFQAERLKRDIRNKEALQSDFIESAQKRQNRVEHHRAFLPQIIEKQRKERERIWDLVRKFFYRWLNKVRAKKAKIPDAAHESLWNVTEDFDETVQYLHKESGFEKLDDFIMGIIKLKRNIQAELEREAALEALEAEEEGSRGGSGGSGGSASRPVSAMPAEE